MIERERELFQGTVDKVKKKSEKNLEKSGLNQVFLDSPEASPRAVKKTGIPTTQTALRLHLWAVKIVTEFCLHNDISVFNCTI